MRAPYPVVLADRHVRLEPLERGHVPGLWAAAADRTAEVFRWVVGWQPAVDAASTSRVVDGLLSAAACGAAYVWVVCDAVEGRVLGSTSYLDVCVPDGRLEVGSTWYARSVWGTVVNPATKLLLLGHAFDKLAVERVALKTDAGNARSQRAIERLGAVREGVLRHHMRRPDGTWRDTVYYSVLAAEWPAVRASLASRLAAS